MNFAFGIRGDLMFVKIVFYNQANYFKYVISLLLEQLDPSDWPERIQLLQKQIRNEEEKDGFSTNASVVQNLKLPHQSCKLPF